MKYHPAIPLSQCLISHCPFQIPETDRHDKRNSLFTDGCLSRISPLSVVTIQLLSMLEIARKF